MRSSRIAFAACLIIATAAQAVERPAPIPTPFDNDGFSVLGRLAPAHCLVGADMRLRTMVAATSDLQQRGLIRQDIDQEHVRAHAWTTASALTLKLQILLIAKLYADQPDLDHCSFVQTVIGADNKRVGAYAFDMTRAIYAGVDWPRFKATDLPMSADNFRIGKQMTDHMNAENKKDR